MFDSREILAAKFWKASRDIKQTYPRSETDFDTFLLALLAINSLTFEASRTNYETTRLTEAALRAKQTITDQYLNSSSETLSYKFSEPFFHFIECIYNGHGYDRSGITIPRDETLINLQRLIDSLLENEQESTLWFVADDIFHRLAKREDQSADHRHTDRIAEFASELYGQNGRITEYFAKSGDLFVKTKHRYGASNFDAMVINPPPYEFALRLRLAIHSIQFTIIDKSFPDFQTHLGCLVIDYVNQPLSTTQSLNHRYTHGNLNVKTTLAAIQKVLEDRIRFDLIISVVVGGDRTCKRGVRQHLRRELIERNLLVAIVDIPAINNRKHMSIWVLTNHPDRKYRGVLCVDACRLINFGRDENHSDILKFAGSIVRLWLKIDTNIYDYSNNEAPDNDSLNAFYRREFSSGYRDVEGFCRVVAEEEFAFSDCVLTASHYFQEQEKNRWFPTLDGSEIIAALRSDNKAPIRIYVIGNNGEGKSLLLRELITELSQLNQRTAGISFGLTDRFPFDRKACESYGFVYLGARTSTNSITLNNTVAYLADLMKKIHTDEQRLLAFNQVTQKLGFENKHFLIPASMLSGHIDDHDRFAEVIELYPEVLRNIERFSEATHGKYKLGLMRTNGKNYITPFDELSSGEQQLLSLAIKLIAMAESGSIMLIDEPEISLHVSWQRAIPAMLKTISEMLNCSMVIATHSPIIVASSDNDGDQCFAAYQRNITRLPQRDLRSVETALFEGFKTYTINNRHVHERCATVVANIIRKLNEEDINENSDIVSNYLNELNQMAETIFSSKKSSNLANTQDDLDLINQTQAAIREILENQ